MGLMCLTMIAFAEFARRALRDRFIAVTCLLGIPLFAFISLQYVFERVEVHKEILVHRREPPHTHLNVDIPWDSIVSANKINREKPGSFAPNFYHVGYELTLQNGRMQELPTNTVLTHAHEEIDRVLEEREIPLEVTTIPIPQ